MKLLMFSDIHNNKKVLSLLAKISSSYTAAVCLGDLAYSDMFLEIYGGVVKDFVSSERTQKFDARKLVYEGILRYSKIASAWEGERERERSFLQCAEILDGFCCPVYFVPGNADPKSWESMIKKFRNIKSLHKKDILVGDTKIVGFGGVVLPVESELLCEYTLTCFDCREASDFFSGQHYRDLIVLTHDAPVLPFGKWLLDIVLDLKPGLWLFGHAHSLRGKFLCDSTRCFACGHGAKGWYLEIDMQTKKVVGKNVFQKTLK